MIHIFLESLKALAKRSSGLLLTICMLYISLNRSTEPHNPALHHNSKPHHHCIVLISHPDLSPVLSPDLSPSHPFSALTNNPQ